MKALTQLTLGTPREWWTGTNPAQLSMLIMKVLGSSMWVRLGVGKQEQGIGLLYGICLMVV